MRCPQSMAVRFGLAFPTSAQRSTDAPADAHVQCRHGYAFTKRSTIPAISRSSVARQFASPRAAPSRSEVWT
jgi:hypothetical protein